MLGKDNQNSEVAVSQRINLKEAEQRAFVANYQDGLWDILVGYIVATFAVVPFLRDPMGDTWSAAIFFPTGMSI